MTISNEHDRGHATTTGNKTSLDERRKAALYVCSRAHDVDDAKHLLQALGLVDAGFHWVTKTPHGPRKKVTE